MLQVKVRSPRARKASPRSIDSGSTIGDAATRIADQLAYGEVQATFALNGRRLDPDERVGTLVPNNATLDLLLGL